MARISTGEDRGEAPEMNQDLDVDAADVADVPAEKPKSIFNFAKPAANG